jgi:hypothetical protein
MAEDGVAGRKGCGTAAAPKAGRAADACCIGKRPDAADATPDRPGARQMIGFGP